MKRRNGLHLNALTVANKEQKDAASMTEPSSRSKVKKNRKDVTCTSKGSMLLSSSLISRRKNFNFLAPVGGFSTSHSSEEESLPEIDAPEHSDRFNYALLVGLYTLQGIPMGLSASIPFLIQQKIKHVAAQAVTATAATASATIVATSSAASASALSYNANAIFALCSWPFSLKLLWAPIVDALFFKSFGRRKTWLVPVQALAGIVMIFGANFVEQQLGLGTSTTANNNNMNVKGVTAFFFVLYFLMATQDIAVDGWALTMLSKKNRGRGPVCNSIGQNLGYFISFVGFLALNDVESSEKLWRPLFGMPSNAIEGLVSLGGFMRCMGFFMLAMTTFVAFFKKEKSHPIKRKNNSSTGSVEVLLTSKKYHEDDEDGELDASEIGLKETYHRLWAVCQLPAVRWLFLILLTYRLPTALSDNVKFLKAVEFGLSKSTTALLSPTVVLPLGIAVPIIAAKIWHGHPLRQFMTAYKLRVTVVPLLDILMLIVIRQEQTTSRALFWFALVGSTGLQAIVNSLQFNAQMTFFASRVDPAIGGSYMTLLNTAANLGGTWPSSLTMLLLGKLTVPPTCQQSMALTGNSNSGGLEEVCTSGRDAYFPLQLVFSVLGCAWVFLLGKKVRYIAELPDDAWRTQLFDDVEAKTSNAILGKDLEAATVDDDAWRRKKMKKKRTQNDKRR